MRRMRKICSCFWITACGLLILMQFAMFRFFDKNNSKFMSLLQMQKATVVNYHDLCHAPNNSRIVIMDFFIHRNERSKVDFVTNKVQDTIDNYARNRTEHDHLTIVFERGNFYIRPVNLTSHMTLCVLPTAQILASNDIDDYSLLEPLPSYGQGREMPGPRYHNLLQLFNATDCTITGGGSINGRGLVWWLEFHHNSLKYTRPHLIEVAYSDQISVYSSNSSLINKIFDIHLFNSPFWTVHLYTSHHIYINHTSIHNPTYYYLPRYESFYKKGFKSYDHMVSVSHKQHQYEELQHTVNTLVGMTSSTLKTALKDERLAPNTDGIVPDSSSFIYLDHLTIHSADDCIAIKSGWEDVGMNYNVPSAYIYITHLECQAPFRSAIAIGSETSGGIHHIYSDHITVVDATRALGIKLAVGRGGHIHDLYYADIQSLSVQYFFVIYSKHNQRKEGYTGTVLPQLDTISIRDVHGFASVLPGLLEGFEEDSWSVSHLHLSNIHLSSPDSWRCNHIKISTYQDVNATTLGNCL